MKIAMKINYVVVFDCVILLSTVITTPKVEADTACRDPLGMESGRINDSQITVSSMYGSADGKGARLNVFVEPWGAWCPNQKDGTNKLQFKQYIQIDLLYVTKVTKVATQGRYGQRGEGREYTRKYKISYSYNKRTWNYYKNRGGDKIFSGNEDTTTVVNNKLSPPISARYIRIHPGYYRDNPRCLRVELYGCKQSTSGRFQISQGIVSYSMPQGQSTTDRNIHYHDTSYTGTERTGLLEGGVGLLTDEKFGPVNPMEFMAIMGRGWVGWHKNLTEPHGVNITFEFDCLRKFNSVTVTMNSDYQQKNVPFHEARIFFAATKDELSEVKYVKYCLKLNEDERIFYNGNIVLSLCGNIGKFVRLQFYSKGQWMLFSEISFDSVPTKDNVTKLTNCEESRCFIDNIQETPRSGVSSQTNILIALICLCIILPVVILAQLVLVWRRKCEELILSGQDIERDLTRRTNEAMEENSSEVEQDEDSHEYPSPYVISDLSYAVQFTTARDGNTANRHQKLLESSNDQSPCSSTQTQQKEQNIIPDPFYTQLTSHRDDNTVNSYQELLKSSNIDVPAKNNRNHDIVKKIEPNEETLPYVIPY